MEYFTADRQMPEDDIITTQHHRVKTRIATRIVIVMAGAVDAVEWVHVMEVVRVVEEVMDREEEETGIKD